MRRSSFRPSRSITRRSERAYIVSIVSAHHLYTGRWTTRFFGVSLQNSASERKDNTDELACILILHSMNMRGVITNISFTEISRSTSLFSTEAPLLPCIYYVVHIDFESSLHGRLHRTFPAYCETENNELPIIRISMISESRL